MKRFHEMPLYFLQKGVEESTCDGHYALVHLYEKSEEYFQHTLNTLKKGREVILDNSLFELGEAFALDDYLNWIERIVENTPKEFISNLTVIAPDSWNNLQESKDAIVPFRRELNKKQLPVRIMAVCQGTTYAELLDCFLWYRIIGIEYIGINFASQAYGETLLDKVQGRQTFICDMLAPYLRETTIKLHLLGCSLPHEFELYKYYENMFQSIESMDTSCPVMHALENTILGVDKLPKGYKPSLKIDEVFFKQNFSDAQERSVKLNCQFFEDLCNSVSPS